MKKLLLFAIICFFLAILTLFFPYAMVWSEDSAQLENIFGYSENIALLQFIIYIVITAISSFKQNLVTGIIGFVLCNSFFLYFIILDFSLTFNFVRSVDLGLGFYLSGAVAMMFGILHIINLVLLIRNKPSKNGVDATELIDNFE